MIGRRGFVGGALLLALSGETVLNAEGVHGMYGMIGSLRAKPGQRDALLTLLLDGSGSMPGCISYVVAEDNVDPDKIWVTEVWTDKASHQASLGLPSVKEAIAKARPLLAGFDMSVETRVLGGVGLPG